MNLVDTLRKKIELLDQGNYMPGLKAVLLHIETAFRHLSRGQETDDDTAFTDAIYRTNQAFEGSIKEAYRVLADQDPAKKRPYDIENYLEQNNTFRSRVLSQLTTYRTEWRNPSTHDYNLDFDESEAFLAIVSVSAFACLLLDQIAEHLSFKKSQAEAEAQKVALAAHLRQSQNATLLVRAIELLSQFCLKHFPQSTMDEKQSESQIIGALHGFLSSAAPELTVQTEALFDSGKRYYADLLLIRNDEKVIIEIKRQMRTRTTPVQIAMAGQQVDTLLAISGIQDGIILFLPERPSKMNRREILLRGGVGNIVFMTPASAGKE